jgi:hypothetical protein
MRSTPHYYTPYSAALGLPSDVAHSRSIVTTSVSKSSAATLLERSSQWCGAGGEEEEEWKKRNGEMGGGKGEEGGKRWDDALRTWFCMRDPPNFALRSAVLATHA